MSLFALFEDGGDVLFWVGDVFDTDDTTEEDVGFGVGLGWRDDTGAINQEDSSHEGNVLPDFGLSGDWGDCADLLGAESVDDGGLSSVGVTDQTDGDLFSVGVEGGELTKELDEGTLSKGVVDVGVEGECRVILREMTNPSGLKVNVSNCPSNRSIDP